MFYGFFYFLMQFINKLSKSTYKYLTVYHVWIT